MEDRYIVGNGTPPEWCRKFLTPYRMLDGTVGLEFYGKTKTINVKRGDVLRREFDDASERLFIAVKTA